MTSTGTAVAADFPLVDHHVHGVFPADAGRGEFEQSLTEAVEPVPPWMTQFDSQLGFAIRRWCAPMLDLPARVSAEEYWRRRAELGASEVAARLLRAAGVSDWIVDTGLWSEQTRDPAAISGARSHRVVRLESVAENVLAESGSGRDYADRFAARLAGEAGHAVGVKTILAYRCGFDMEWTRPDPTSVRLAANRLQGQFVLEAGADMPSAGAPRPGLRPRLCDPVLLRFGLYAAVDLGLPIQVHTGFGDPDLDLATSNPLLLLDFLRQPRVAGVPILLLHCYPYHREAGYLAQVFPNVHFDVGLGVNHLGVRSTELIAESFELAPFAKQLYSSDAWGPPELHYLGARLWRRAVETTFGRWVDSGDWTAEDARRVAEMVGRRNALRVYGLT